MSLVELLFSGSTVHRTSRDVGYCLSRILANKVYFNMLLKRDIDAVKMFVRREDS